MLNSRYYLVTLTIFVKIKVYIYPVGELCCRCVFSSFHSFHISIVSQFGELHFTMKNLNVGSFVFTPIEITNTLNPKNGFSELNVIQQSMISFRNPVNL